MKNIDVHIHTTGSDGSYTPTELVNYAVEKGLSAVAITDHDTMRGVEESLDLIKKKELSDYGLNGIEGYYTTHSDSYILDIKNIVSKYHMVITGGTDFHGTRKPGVDLGSGFGDLRIPYKVLEDLRKIKS